MRRSTGRRAAGDAGRRGGAGARLVAGRQDAGVHGAGGGTDGKYRVGSGGAAAPTAEGRTRLYTVAAEGGEAREAALGNLEPVGEPAWMPDGRSLLLALAEPFDPERPLEGPEIYSLRLEGPEPRRLTHHPGADFNPLPAPDGRRIAWLAREAAQQSYTPAKLWVANADGSRARPLAGELDREPENPQWSADSRTLYFVAEDRGQSRTYMRPATMAASAGKRGAGGCTVGGGGQRAGGDGAVTRRTGDVLGGSAGAGSGGAGGAQPGTAGGP